MDGFHICGGMSGNISSLESVCLAGREDCEGMGISIAEYLYQPASIDRFCSPRDPTAIAILTSQVIKNQRSETDMHSEEFCSNWGTSPYNLPVSSHPMSAFVHPTP